MNKFYSELTQLTGISSIYVRGFMDQFQEGSRSLRECQENGVAAVKEFNASISVATISKRARLLADADVVPRRRAKGKYILSEGENLAMFLDFLDENTDYGTRMSGSAEQDVERGKAYDHIETHGALRSTPESRIPAAAYKMLMQQVKEGKLDIAFIKSGLKGGVKYNGTTELIRPLADD